MGTLSNKYFNAQAVEEALDKGVAAYDSMGQIELVYNGTDIRFNNEVVNFQQIVDYITTDARFCYMVYNNRVLLTSDMQLTGGTRYVFFETSTTDSGLSKNTVVKVYSSNGTTISSISHSTIANENFSNKVSTIADNDKNSTVHYPSNKAVTEITDEIKEDLSENYVAYTWEYGKNLFNKDDTDNQLAGFYFENTSGQKITNNTYTSQIVEINSNNNTISINKTYLFVTFYSEKPNIVNCSLGRTPNGFISGVLIQTDGSNIAIPFNAKYLVISYSTSAKSTLQIEYGSAITAYEPFHEPNKYIDGEQIGDNTIPVSKLQTSITNYDNSAYALPFIKDKKCCCNKVANAGTAYYAGVDTQGTPNHIECKFIWEGNKTRGGTVALILQKNGLTKVSDITNKSFHLVITPTTIALNLLLNGTSYNDVISTNLINPMNKDGITENTVSVDISGNAVTVIVNGDSYSGTFSDTTYNLSDFIGRYAQFEHYANGDMDNVSMPMFTWWKVTGDQIWTPVIDNFSRPDGLLWRTPTGYLYKVFTNQNSGY